MPAVVVATIRALKMHGGVGKIVAGKPLDPALLEENVAAVTAGGANLAKQIENVRLFNVPVVVAINSFPTDTPAEVEAVARSRWPRARATPSSPTTGRRAARERRISPPRCGPPPRRARRLQAALPGRRLR